MASGQPRDEVRGEAERNTHVDMLNAPAEYTAASANPITVPMIKAMEAATIHDTKGMRRIGHSGGRGRYRPPPVLFPLSLCFSRVGDGEGLSSLLD